ncbi:hypothetical protein HC761_00860 [bacterium]|nr:hypothetical protein [bacterium]
MITAPLMADKVDIKLPEAPSEEVEDEVGVQKVTLSIVDNKGIPQYYWNDQIITVETMAARMKSEALRTQNKIRMKVRADKTLRYETVSKVLLMAKENGVQNVSFISAPAPKG